MGIADSHPCPERCPYAGCGERCYGRQGHGSRRTAGKGYAELHQCRRHAWGMLAEWHEAQRSIESETRRECMESLAEAQRSAAGRGGERTRKLLATGG